MRNRGINSIRIGGLFFQKPSMGFQSAQAAIIEYHNRTEHHGLGDLNSRHLLLAVPVSGNPRSQCWWSLFLVGVIFWFAHGCLLAVPSQGRKIISLVSFYKGTNPILGLCFLLGVEVKGGLLQPVGHLSACLQPCWATAQGMREGLRRASEKG